MQIAFPYAVKLRPVLSILNCFSSLDETKFYDRADRGKPPTQSIKYLCSILFHKKQKVFLNSSKFLTDPHVDQNIIEQRLRYESINKPSSDTIDDDHDSEENVMGEYDRSR